MEAIESLRPADERPVSRLEIAEEKEESERIAIGVSVSISVMRESARGEAEGRAISTEGLATMAELVVGTEMREELTVALKARMEKREKEKKKKEKRFISGNRDWFG